MVTRVLINGAEGRMGQEAYKAIAQTTDLVIIAKATKADNLASLIQKTQAEIVLDLTVASAVYTNTKTIIENNARPVIGTTGLTVEQIAELQAICHNKQLGGIIAPNFSIGANLMMKYAKDAAQYLPSVEIIELHHDKKQDAPSGTSIKTAHMIAENRLQVPSTTKEQELLKGARGAEQNNIHIHSVRLSGLVAHQVVIFGGNSETLTLRHDSYHRECFMPGILLACRKVIELKELIYGLEHLL